MRSAMTSWSTPCSGWPPSMWMVLLPAPSMTRAHPAEKGAQVGDLGLPGGVLDHRHALGGGGRHEQVLGGAHARVVQRDRGPLSLSAVDLDEAVVDLHRRPELLEAADVEVDAPRPDVAASGHGDGRLAETRHERSHDDDAGAHRAHELVGRAAAQAGAGVHAQLVAGVVHLRAERAQHLDHGRDVGDARHAAHGAGLVGEEAGGEQLEGRVLGPREEHGALQPSAAAYEQACVVFAGPVHQTVTSIAAGRARRSRAQRRRPATCRRFSARLSACSARKKSTSAWAPGSPRSASRSRARRTASSARVHVDGAGELAVVDDHEHLVEQHLRVADAGGDVLPRAVEVADARLADAQQRDQRLVTRQDAELAVDAGQHDHADVVAVDLAVRRDDLDVQGALLSQRRPLRRPLRGRPASRPARRPRRCRRP